MDILGAGFLISAIVCLLLALQWGGSVYPWKDSKVWGCLLGFGLLISIFIGIQIWRGDLATLPPRIIAKQRTVRASAIFSVFLAMALYTHIYYLPFYFQAVKGTTAEGSGIRTSRDLVSITLSCIGVGFLVTLVGTYVPFTWVGSAIFAVGSGMIYTLKVDSSAARWIGYQILAGVGSGACVQIPFIAVQVVLSKKDMPIGNATAIFFNSLGGAISISIAQNIFSNSLTKQLLKQAPTVDPRVVITAGATHFRQFLTPEQLPGVLLAYNNALTDAYILGIACAGLAFLASLTFEWKSVKGHKLDMGAAAG